jgi:excisionase family DNA binding protein
MTQIIYNALTAADLDALLQAAEARGEKRGYERAKLEEEAPMTTREAATFMGVSQSTIRDWSSKGIIKMHKIGGNNYYYKHELKP